MASPEMIISRITNLREISSALAGAELAESERVVVKELVVIAIDLLAIVVLDLNRIANALEKR